MKNTCKIFSLLLLVITLVACSSNSQLEGKYYVTSMESDGIEYDYHSLESQGITDEIYLEFTSENTIKMFAGGTTKEVTYDVDAKTVHYDTEVVSYKVDGDDFVMYDDDNTTITYTKEGSAKLIKLQEN